jgi:hypothetical protein
VRCKIDKTGGGYLNVDKLTFSELQKRCVGLSDEELKQYPHVKEYWFEPTEQGRIEEAKSIYDDYYPES